SNGAITFVPDNAASHTVRSSGPDGTVLTIAANAVINGGSPSLTSTISSTGAGVQAILNLGTITADANSGIVINADAFTNQGTVRAASGSTLRIAAANWTSENGSLGADGGTLDIGGTVTSAGLGLPTFFRNGGTVNLIGTVTNTAATMTLNAQTGTFTLNGGVITGGTLTLIQRCHHLRPRQRRLAHRPFLRTGRHRPHHRRQRHHQRRLALPDLDHLLHRRGRAGDPEPGHDHRRRQ
ncbi:MAG: hypothetical protein DWB46_03810, partial [Leptolyngbya sp.]|nr:hypothetical protein [Leptolyngbya sp.]